MEVTEDSISASSLLDAEIPETPIDLGTSTQSEIIIIEGYPDVMVGAEWAIFLVIALLALMLYMTHCDHRRKLIRRQKDIRLLTLGLSVGEISSNQAVKCRSILNSI